MSLLLNILQRCSNAEGAMNLAKEFVQGNHWPIAKLLGCFFFSGSLQDLGKTKHKRTMKRAMENGYWDLPSP